MKQKFSIAIIAMLVVQFYCTAQKSSIGLSGGYATDGVGFFMQYNHYVDKESKQKIQVGLSYSIASQKVSSISIPYNDIGLTVGYGRIVYESQYEQFLASVQGGGIVGYEVINNGNIDLNNGSSINAESQLIYGAYIGTDFSYFISDYLALNLVVNQYYHANSDLGNFSFYAGIGTKFFIY